ncbi:MAG: FHA domain-containing protein [Candidatus Methylacidiphilales bacterium]
MSRDTKDLGSSVFHFAEILQHYGQTGRTGLFTIHGPEGKGYVYLMSGIVAHAETEMLSGDIAIFDILSWSRPPYEWQDAVTPSRMTMSATVQDLLLGSIQIQASGELDSVKKNASHFHKTRSISDENNRYYILFTVSSSELPRFDYQVTTKQLRIGRHPENDLVLPDTSVSRKHALCIFNQETILVRDLGSMNGIKVDGQPVTHGLAKSGQIITVGEVNCEISISLVAPESSSRILSPAA